MAKWLYSLGNTIWLFTILLRSRGVLSCTQTHTPPSQAFSIERRGVKKKSASSLHSTQIVFPLIWLSAARWNFILCAALAPRLILIIPRLKKRCRRSSGARERLDHENLNQNRRESGERKERQIDEIKNFRRSFPLTPLIFIPKHRLTHVPVCASWINTHTEQGMRLGVCVFASSKGYSRMRQGPGQGSTHQQNLHCWSKQASNPPPSYPTGKEKFTFHRAARGYCCGRALTSKRAEKEGLQAARLRPERVMMHRRRAQLSTHGAKVSLLLQFDSAGVRSATLFLHCN